MPAAEVGSLRVTLGLDSAQFTNGMTAAEKRLRDVGKTMQSVGAKMAGIGAGMTAAITGPLIAVGFAASKAATEAAEAMGQVEAALTSMGDASGKTKEELAGLAEGLMRSSLYDDDEILRKVTANLLTFGNIAGQAFDRAQQAAVDLATRMGTDLQSATLLVGKALNDPIKGMSALGRAGIQFSESQKATTKSMVDAGNAAGAQAMILTELEKQFGGAAAAAQATDPYDSLRDSLGTLSESLGGIINTAIVPMLNALAKLADKFSSLSPEMQKTIVVIAAVVAVVGPLLIGLGAVVSAVGVLMPILAGVVPVMAAVGAAIAAVATVAMPALIAVLGVILSPIGLVVAAVAGLIAIWVVFGDDIKRIAGRVGETISVGFGVAVTAVRRMVEGVKSWLVGKLFDVLESVIRKVKGVSDAFFNLYDAVVGNSFVPDMVEGIAEWMAKLDAGMVTPAKNATDATKAAFESLRADVAAIMDRLLTDTERAARQLAQETATINAAVAAGQMTRGQGNRAIAGIAGENLTNIPIPQLGSLGTEAKDIAASMREGLANSRKAFDDTAREFGDRFSYHMEDVLRGDIMGVFQDMISDMLRQSLSNLGTSLFKSFGNSSGGGLDWGKIGSSVAGMFGGKKLPGFATGGTFKVGGSAGLDKNVVAFRATKGEMVDIRRPGQGLSGGGMSARIMVETNDERFNAYVDDRARPFAQGALSGARSVVPADMAKTNRYSRGR